MRPFVLFAACAVVVVACTRKPPPDRVELPAASGLTRPPPAETGSAGTAGAHAEAKRCLPVVAAECGCVWGCGTGVESAPGVWAVSHPHGGGAPLRAKVGPWCVANDCTDAFLVELECDGICAPKPADHGCHFDDERCTGS